MKLPAPSLPLITLTLGILGYAAFSSLYPVPKPLNPGKRPVSGIDFVDLAQISVRSDQAFLEDSAPLFLATKWNASHSPTTTLDPDLVEISVYPPELHAPTSPLFVDGPKTAFLKPPSRSILRESKKPFTTLGLGLSSNTLPVEVSKGGKMSITRVGSPKDTLVFSLTTEVLSKSETGIWPPVEFFCTVENLTVMGSPARTKSSGINELDEALAQFARRKVSSNGLRAGYYRITASP